MNEKMVLFLNTGKNLSKNQGKQERSAKFST